MPGGDSDRQPFFFCVLEAPSTFKAGRQAARAYGKAAGARAHPHSCGQRDEAHPYSGAHALVYVCVCVCLSSCSKVPGSSSDPMHPMRPTRHAPNAPHASPRTSSVTRALGAPRPLRATRPTRFFCLGFDCVCWPHSQHS